MNKSESIKALASALACFQGKMAKIKKDSNNPFFKSKYASLSNILEAIQTPLSEYGLCFSQFPTDNHGLTTILIHAETGEFLESTYFMKPVKDDPQGVGSSITYQRRYSLAAVLGLNIDEDDDGNGASQKPAAPTQKEQEDNRPWLNDKQFHSAMERITNGEDGVLAKLNKAFKMKKDYKQQLEEAEKGVLA